MAKLQRPMSTAGQEILRLAWAQSFLRQQRRWHTPVERLKYSFQRFCSVKSLEERTFWSGKSCDMITTSGQDASCLAEALVEVDHHWPNWPASHDDRPGAAVLRELNPTPVGWRQSNDFFCNATREHAPC